MIKANDAKVYITEKTAKELMQAIEQAKEEVEFTTDPMSDCDMSEEDFMQEKKKRGEIIVRSPFSKIEFVISIEGGPNENQESLGYKLV